MKSVGGANFEVLVSPNRWRGGHPRCFLWVAGVSTFNLLFCDFLVLNKHRHLLFHPVCIHSVLVEITLSFWFLVWFMRTNALVRKKIFAGVRATSPLHEKPCTMRVLAFSSHGNYIRQLLRICDWSNPFRLWLFAATRSTTLKSRRKIRGPKHKSGFKISRCFSRDQLDQCFWLDIKIPLIKKNYLLIDAKVVGT